MNYLALDLEMNQPSGLIIQAGLVVGDIKTGNIIDKLGLIINPNEPLNPYIIKLTGITEEIIQNEGISLQEAYQKILEFYKKHDCFCNPITWGQGDIECLKSQLGSVEHWPFGRRIIDVKTLYVACRMADDKPVQGGLAKVMTKMGLKFEGRKHDAVSDSLNTFRLYCEFLKKFKGIAGWV